MEGHAATAIVLPLNLTNHLALIKTSDVTNIAGVSSRSKNRGAMRRWRSSFWQDVAQGRIRYERFWEIMATVGGEAVWGVGERRFGDHTGPEWKMSAGGAQSDDSTRHP